MAKHDDSGPVATMTEAVREYARNVGSERPDREWILSPFDTWERNPYYRGAPGPHPEDQDPGDEVLWTARADHGPNGYQAPPVKITDTDLPF